MLSTKYRATLRSLNFWVGVWHCVLGGVIVIVVMTVGSPFQLKLTKAYEVVDSAKLPPALQTSRCTDRVTNVTTDFKNVFDYLRCIAPVNVPLTLSVIPTATIQVWVLLLIFELVTAISHFRMVRYDQRYHELLNLRLNPARWREYSVTNTLMLVSILTLTGISELYLVLHVVLGAVFMNYCGGLVFELLAAIQKELTPSEQIAGLIREAKRVILILAWVAFLLPLMYLFEAFNTITSSYYALQTGPLWRQLFQIVFVLNVGITICYSAFPVLHLLPISYMRLEVAYIIASLTAKSFLTIIVMAATVQRS